MYSWVSCWMSNMMSFNYHFKTELYPLLSFSITNDKNIILLVTQIQWLRFIFYSYFPHASYILTRTSFCTFIFLNCSDRFFSFDPPVKFLIQTSCLCPNLSNSVRSFLFICKSDVASLKPKLIPSFRLLAFSFPFLFYILLKASCLKFKLLTEIYMGAFQVWWAVQ